jgi:cyclopropane-fatty-acyl-phospholipid synthase
MLGHFLSRLIARGTLRVTWPNGRSRTFGQGEPRASIRFTDALTPYRIASRPELSFGEAYMDGRLIVEEGDIADVVKILLMNDGETRHPPLVMRMARALRRAMKPISQFNPMNRARRNVAHHYDLSAALYDLFLDSDRQYSCAYFLPGNGDLEQAQKDKKRHIAAKLRLHQPGLKVFDIGCGWGGLGLELASEYGAKVEGITLSREQLSHANERAKKAGLEPHCRFHLTDYRAVRGRFDRIVSVGMFEHVGVRYYETYFRKIAELLDDDGVALLHTIGRLAGPGSTNPWIAKYIFPGGYVPALSEVLPAIERAGLLVTDIEILRLHYAQTIEAWRARFAANRDKVSRLYDERFCRMWEFYLAGAEMAFRYDKQAVFQIKLAKNVDSLPLNRDYMFEVEHNQQLKTSRRSHAA